MRLGNPYYETRDYTNRISFTTCVSVLSVAKTTSAVTLSSTERTRTTWGLTVRAAPEYCM